MIHLAIRNLKGKKQQEENDAGPMLRSQCEHR